MKVLHFIETGGPGGAERVVATLAAAMHARGIEVAVLTLRTGWLTDTLDNLGIPRFHLSSERSLDIGLPFRIARIIKEQKFEVLHSHLLDSNFYGGLAARIARVSHLATEHGDVHHLKKKRMLGLKLRVLGFLDTHFSAVSQYTAEHLLSFGIRRRQVCCIGNPVSLPLSRDPVVRLERRAALEIPGSTEEHWLWIHVANMRQVKDQATLLRGFATAIRETSVPQTLALAGDGPERPALERLARELGISARVRFLGFQEEVAPWLQAADGFILSSRSEALPMSLLEAAIAGLVLISSEVGGIGEIIRREETGFLFPAGDPDALARRITEAVQDRERSAAYAARARHLVETHYTVDTIVDSYLSAY